ncbi:hypothetical protein [Arthrospira platensis]
MINDGLNKPAPTMYNGNVGAGSAVNLVFNDGLNKPAPNHRELW